jgi:hypothetical protein
LWIGETGSLRKGFPQAFFKMTRLLRVLIVLILFELGMLLIFLPWSSQWEHNYFLTRYPELIRILLHPSMRGLISGLGVLDIFVAVSLLKRPADNPVEQ